MINLSLHVTYIVCTARLKYCLTSSHITGTYCKIVIKLKFLSFLGFEGCYSTLGNQLPDFRSATRMSSMACIEYCYGIYKPFAALQASKCFCLDRHKFLTLNIKDKSHCNERCTGHGMNYCGGSNAVNVYLVSK